MTRIAIIGGHGKVALELSRILAADGQDVTSFIRNPDHAADVAATGATPAVLDVERSTTAEIAEALRNHDAVVWSAGAGGGNPERTYAVDRDAAIRSMDAADQAGVGRYIMVSYLGAGPEHGVPPEDGFYAYAVAKAAADTYLRATDLGWTILGPGRLTDGPGTGLIDVNPDGASHSTDLAHQRGPRGRGGTGPAGPHAAHHSVPRRRPAHRRSPGRPGLTGRVPARIPDREERRALSPARTHGPR